MLRLATHMNEKEVTSRILRMEDLEPNASGRELCETILLVDTMRSIAAGNHPNPVALAKHLMDSLDAMWERDRAK